MLFQTAKSTSNRASSRTLVRRREEAGNTVIISYRDMARANRAALGEAVRLCLCLTCVKEATSGWTGEKQRLHKDNIWGNIFKLKVFYVTAENGKV